MQLIFTLRNEAVTNIITNRFGRGSYYISGQIDLDADDDYC